jgi:hypothetical protein
VSGVLVGVGILAGILALALWQSGERGRMLALGTLVLTAFFVAVVLVVALTGELFG